MVHRVRSYLFKAENARIGGGDRGAMRVEQPKQLSTPSRKLGHGSHGLARRKEETVDPGVLRIRGNLCHPRPRHLSLFNAQTRQTDICRSLNSQRPPMPALQVRQIDHVTFVVQSLERSRAFYVDLLGMQPVPRPNFSFPGLWFQVGSTQIHLILEHHDCGPATVFVPENCSISRTRHIAFEVASAAEAVRVLAEHDIEIVAGPKARPDGPTQLYVFDPDRNLIELFSYGP